MATEKTDSASADEATISLQRSLYDPGYVKEDQYVDFNINVYSVTDDKLLWASRSQTQNPSSVPSMVDATP